MHEPSAAPEVSITLPDDANPLEQAQAIIEQIQALPEAERTAAIARVFGVTEEQAANMAVVKDPSGVLRAQFVSKEAADRLRRMKQQGFQTASFQNRRQRRAALAAARRK